MYVCMYACMHACIYAHDVLRQIDGWSDVPDYKFFPLHSRLAPVSQSSLLCCCCPILLSFLLLSSPLLFSPLFFSPLLSSPLLSSPLLTKASISSPKPHGPWREMQTEADFISIKNLFHFQRNSQHDSLSCALSRTLPHAFFVRQYFSLLGLR